MVTDMSPDVTDRSVGCPEHSISFPVSCEEPETYRCAFLPADNTPIVVPCFTGRPDVWCANSRDPDAYCNERFGEREAVCGNRGVLSDEEGCIPTDCRDKTCASDERCDIYTGECARLCTLDIACDAPLVCSNKGACGDVKRCDQALEPDAFCRAQALEADPTLTSEQLERVSCDVEFMMGCSERP